MTDPQNKGIRNVKGGIVVTGCKPMTPDAQQPQGEHYKHKCVCSFYSNFKPCRKNEPKILKCGWDTRSHPHTPAPEPELPDNYWYCPFRKGCEDGESWCSWPCSKWAIWHDAAITRTATLATLDELLCYINPDSAAGRHITQVKESLRHTAQKEQR